MPEKRGHPLAALADEAAAGADDMRDVAAALRGHVAERGDDVDRLLEAFEYIHRERDRRSAFIPAMQADEPSYPAPLEQVDDDTLTLWPRWSSMPSTRRCRRGCPTCCSTADMATGAIGPTSRPLATSS